MVILPICPFYVQVQVLHFWPPHHLGKPSDEELLTDTIRDKAVKYYTQVGLKFAYTNSNGNSADWAYLKIENSAIIVKNCLN